MAPLRVWLDDKRPAPEGWFLVKTAMECIRLLAEEQVEELELDHDLGHCEQCEGCSGYRSSCACTCHMTGYSVVLYMVTTGRWPKKKPGVHSRNPTGAEKMRNAIERYYHTWFSPIAFSLNEPENAKAERFQRRHQHPDVTWPSRGVCYKFTPTEETLRKAIVCNVCHLSRRLDEKK